MQSTMIQYEVARILEGLPTSDLVTVLDFARFVQARAQSRQTTEAHASDGQPTFFYDEADVSTDRMCGMD
jgi:hypothetical protein